MSKRKKGTFVSKSNSNTKERPKFSWEYPQESGGPGSYDIPSFLLSKKTEISFTKAASPRNHYVNKEMMQNMHLKATPSPADYSPAIL